MDDGVSLTQSGTRLFILSEIELRFLGANAPKAESNAMGINSEYLVIKQNSYFYIFGIHVDSTP